jgi:hypothetical protein
MPRNYAYASKNQYTIKVCIAAPLVKTISHHLLACICVLHSYARTYMYQGNTPYSSLPPPPTDKRSNCSPNGTHTHAHSTTHQQPNNLNYTPNLSPTRCLCRFVKACVGVVQRVASSQLLSLREETGTVSQCLPLLWLLPLNISRVLLQALLPLSCHSDALCDRLMLLFRKELYSPDLQRRCLAIHGVCLMLSTGALLESQQQVDALVLLKPLLSGGSEVRSEVYQILYTLITQCRSDNGQASTLCGEAYNLLGDILTWRMRRCLSPTASAPSTGGKESACDGKEHVGNNGKGHARNGKEYLSNGKESVCNGQEMNDNGRVHAGNGKEHSCTRASGPHLSLDTCFENVRMGDVQRRRPRENLCLLVKCFAALSRHDEQASAMMRSFAQQLSCPSEVAALITGASSSADGDNHEAQTQCAEVDATARVSMLLSLYDVLIEECSATSCPEWAKQLSGIWEGTCPSQVWMFMYSIVSRLVGSGQESAPQASNATANLSASAVHKPLSAMEHLCDAFIPRNTPARPGSSLLSQQAPVICKLVERVLEHANKLDATSAGPHMPASESEGPSTSSGAAGRPRGHDTAGNSAFPWSRVLACTARIYQHSHARPHDEDRQSRHTRRKTRLTAVRCDDDDDESSDSEDEEPNVSARAQSDECLAANRSVAAIVASAEKLLQERLQEMHHACAHTDKHRASNTAYHRMRNALLQTLRLCISKECTPGQLLACLQTEELPIDVHSHGQSDGKGAAVASRRGDAAESAHVACADYLCKQLYAEAEHGVSLPVLTEYLDLLQAIRKSEKDRAHMHDAASQDAASSWEGVCQKLMGLLSHFEIAKVQVLRRVLALSLDSLETGKAASFCIRVMCHAFSIDQDMPEDCERAFQQASSQDSDLEPVDCELPDTESIAIKNCTACACLRHLLTLFPVEKTAREMPVAQLRTRVHSLVIVMEVSNKIPEVSGSVRALLIRICKRAMAWYSDTLTRYVSAENKNRASTQRILLLARQTLAYVDALCASLRSIAAAATDAAQLRHAAYKCSAQIAAFLPSVARSGNGDVAQVARDVENLIQKLQQSDGKDGNATAVDGMDDVGHRKARRSSRKRRRLRSRNAYIDAGLAEEDGDDDYGDLEDFIVCKDGAVY